MSQSNGPSLKSRLLNLEDTAVEMRSTLSDMQTKIRSMTRKIEDGTQANILTDKINFTRDILVQRIDQIENKIKKHIMEQKQRNNQLVQMIGNIKNEKSALQREINVLKLKINQMQEIIGIDDTS